MPRRTKNAKDREKSVADKMKGQMFEDVILKSDNVINWNTLKRVKMKGQMFEDVILKGDNKVINWNTVKRVWRKSSGEF